MSASADRQRTTIALANAYLLGDSEAISQIALETTRDMAGALQIQTDAVVFATVLSLVEHGIDKVLAHPRLLVSAAAAAVGGEPVTAKDLNLDPASILAAAGRGAMLTP